MNDQFTPDEQYLINQLKAAPKPSMRTDVREAIRQQMLAEFQAMPLTPQPATPQITPQPLTWLRPLPVLIAAAFAAAIISIAWLQSRTPEQATSDVLTPGPTGIAQVSTATATASLTPEPTATDLPTLTPEPPTLVPSETPVPPTITWTPTIPPEPSPGAVISIAGPIVNIENNVLTIYDFEVAVDPQHPILDMVTVGDVVRVEGSYAPDGMITAAVVSNLTDITPAPNTEPATVSLDGPVESVEDNIITVNDIAVELDPDDPLLQTVRVGDFVSVEGNFETSGGLFVLVVVKITVINDVTIIENECWYHETGMGMGHWHCDGMGMGQSDAAMGMGDPPAGVGNEGMGVPPAGVGSEGMGDSGMGNSGMGNSGMGG